MLAWPGAAYPSLGVHIDTLFCLFVYQQLRAASTVENRHVTKSQRSFLSNSQLQMYKNANAV